MRLRRQLILVSLLTLCLPWAGCQYIQEMENALRQGQSVALTASAQAVAARLSSEPALRETLQQPAARGNPNSQIYLHPLNMAPIIDGYDDDWRSLDLDLTLGKQVENTFSLAYWAGIHTNQIYLLIKVADPDLTYHDPGKARMASGDHIILMMGDKDKRHYIIRTSAPGNVTARYLNASGHIRQEHSIQGSWLEIKGGYQLEIRIPRKLTQDKLGFQVVNRLENGQQQALSVLNEQSQASYFVSHQNNIEQAISIFTDDRLRLRVIFPNQWLIAQSGQFVNTQPRNTKQHGFLTWLYRTALGNPFFPGLDQPEQTGRMRAEETGQALSGHIGTRWYQYGDLRIGRAAVPIINNNQVLGAVIAEQSTDSVLALTNTAFNRLFFYTFFATAVAGAGLLIYASWLSFRIRRLNRAADNAIGENGQILNDFPDSRAKDEVGDLTRSYGQLLNRLKEYTEYLRTLSGKLSHELRTPLAVVQSSLDNLAYEPLSPQAKTYVERAREGGTRLSGILTAMSAASRVEESIKSTEPESFDLSQLLTDVTAAYRDIYTQSNLNLIIDETGNNYKVHGSPELIVQMLDKLVDNATDFCPSDGVISLCLKRTHSSIHLIISNDGPLLPPHMQGQLFDSLVSIRTQKSDKPHMGLGLHIVRLIANCHKGSVNAYNREDASGVTFEVILPA